MILTIVAAACSPSNQAHPASPSSLQPSPVANYGPPPAGVPLIYLVDPSNTAMLQGYDWSGKPRGTLDLTADALPSPGGVLMAPDGSAFEVGVARKGASGVFLDRLGRPIPVQAAPYVTGSMWADDSKHQCQVTLDPQTYIWGLSTKVPGEAAKSVSVIAQDQGVGQSGINLAACSFTHDAAILVRYTIAWPSELWVVRLSNGANIGHHLYTGAQLSNIVASRDGALIAENTVDVAQLGVRQTPGITIVRRVSDWSQVATVGLAAVRAFNGDDSLVLMTNSVLPEVPYGLSVRDWRSGSAIWTYQGSEGLSAFTTEPAGRGFALALAVPDQVLLTQLRDILIVHADGSTTKIPGRFLTTW